MTEPIRLDALAADDRLLNDVGGRRYAGSDPLGSLLLTFAQACDDPAPARRPVGNRRSTRRVVISTVATAAFLASGAGGAAAVTHHVPDGGDGWAARVERWWTSLPGAFAGIENSAAAVPTAVATPSASGSGAAAIGAPTGHQVPLSVPVPASVPPAQQAHGNAAIPASPDAPDSPADAPNQRPAGPPPTSQAPGTPPANGRQTPPPSGGPGGSVTTPPNRPAAPPGQTSELDDGSGSNRDPEFAKGRNIPRSMVEVIDLAEPPAPAPATPSSTPAG